MTYGLTKGIADQSGAADAYKNASSVTESVSGEDAMKHFQDNYVPQEGGPATAQEFALQNPESMAGLTSDRKASYSMGGKQFDQAPTDSQKTAAGLRGSQEYYASTGNTEEAARIGRQAQQSRLGEQSITAGDRAERKAELNEQELQKFHGVMQSFQNPETAAKYIIDAYSKNLGAYGQGEHKDQSIQFEASPDGGGKAWTVDASGKATSAPQVFNKDQIIKEAQSAYWRNTDPAGYAKAAEAQAARAAERQVDFADKVSLEKVKGEIRSGLEDVKAQGRIDVNAAKPAGSGRGSAGLDSASKGAKFDIDGEGNRVILYRNGSMVYPKDADGNVIKIKAGTDLDQKYTRDITKIYASKNGMAPDDPVAAAKDLTQRTKTGAAPASVAQTANQIKADMKAGKITREAAITQLQAIGYK